VRAAIIGIMLTLAASAHAQTADRPTHERERFEVNHAASPGTAVFIGGDLPARGAGDPRRAVKLIQTAPSLWSADMALPAGADSQYQIYERNPSESQIGNAANATAIGPPLPLNAHATSAAPPTRSVFLHSDLDRVLLHWSQGGAEEQTIEMERFGAGRTAGESLFVAHSFGKPGQRLTFRFTDKNGAGGFPTPFPHSSDLTASFVQDGRIYASIPPEAHTPARIETRALATNRVRPTRTIDGITGRGYRVLLPANYDTSDRSYPVVYMHDGQNVFTPGGPFGTWSVDVIAPRLAEFGQSREAIIVGVDNSSDRSAEYAPAFPSGGINADDYLAFLLEELKPVIDAEYRTLPGRDTTVVAGSSFGGVASLHAGFDYPDTVGVVGLFSGSWWATPNLVPAALGDANFAPRVYLDVGTDNDGYANALNLYDGLLGTGRFAVEGNLRWVVGFGQAHNEPAWRSRVDEFLSFAIPAAEADQTELLSMAPNARWDIDGDGAYSAEDLMDFERAPVDLNFDGLTDSADRRALERWVRRNELDDMTNGRR